MKHALAMVSVIATSCASLGKPVNAPLPPDHLVAISYSPGFIGTPPWELRITPDGRVYLQATSRSEGTTSTQVYKQRRLSPSEIHKVSETIASAKLNELRPRYEFGGTDQETLTIDANTNNPAAVSVYGPQWGCDRAEVQRFLAVWNAVVKLVSVPTTKHTKHVYTRCYARESAVQLWLAADAVPFAGPALPRLVRR